MCICVLKRQYHDHSCRFSASVFLSVFVQVWGSVFLQTYCRGLMSCHSKQKGSKVSVRVQGCCHPLTDLCMQLCNRQEGKNESQNKLARYEYTCKQAWIFSLSVLTRDFMASYWFNLCPFLVTFPSTYFSAFLQVFCNFYFHASTRSFSCVSSISLISRLVLWLYEVVRFIATVQSSNLSVPSLISRAVLSSSATHLHHHLPFALCSSSHSLSYSSLAPPATPSPSHKEETVRYTGRDRENPISFCCSFNLLCALIFQGPLQAWCGSQWEQLCVLMQVSACVCVTFQL